MAGAGAGTEPARCFGLRRVNPFLGVVAVVKTDSARALSLDGVHWQIQILAHPPRGLWTGDGDSDKLQYFRFGAWSAAHGLQRVPLNPILDLDHMLRASGDLCEQIAANLGKIPFPLAPELEQWLLDPEGVPLALIATTVDTAVLHPSELAQASATDWSGGARGDRPFISLALTPPGTANTNRLAHVEALERLVRQAAGRRRSTQWFRGEGDTRIGLDLGAPPELAGRDLPDTAFPPLTLRTEWPDDRDARLAADYVAWLSPYLLTLTNLSDQTRRDLELDAMRHALVVDDLWRLYPRVLDSSLLARARVEAKLRRAHA
jgi:hypothetical protein